jgi:predicted O-methyltransferase YrrM
VSSLALEILRSGEVQAADGSRFPLTSHISEREGRFLQSLIRELQPRVSLEVGLAFGMSALFLCEELAKVGAQRHIVIDPYQSTEYRNVGLENLRRAGVLSLVDLREEPSYLELPRLAAQGVEIDFAFIDGMHTFDYALLDFLYVDRMLRVGGVVAFDDANWPALRKLVRYVLCNRSYRWRASLPKHLGLRKLIQRYGSPGGVRELVADRRLGIAIPHSRCVALEKVGNDARSTDSHRDF